MFWESLEQIPTQVLRLCRGKIPRCLRSLSRPIACPLTFSMGHRINGYFYTGGLLGWASCNISATSPRGSGGSTLILAEMESRRLSDSVSVFEKNSNNCFQQRFRETAFKPPSRRCGRGGSRAPVYQLSGFRKAFTCSEWLDPAGTARTPVLICDFRNPSDRRYEGLAASSRGHERARISCCAGSRALPWTRRDPQKPTRA